MHLKFKIIPPNEIKVVIPFVKKWQSLESLIPSCWVDLSK